MSPGVLAVPVLPPIDDALLTEYDETHAALSRAVSGAGPAERVFTLLQRRLLVESLANVQPVVAGPDPPLFPAPRAFLTRPNLLRMAAASAAVEFIDTRLTMHRRGLVECVLDQATPVVLHALTEAAKPSTKVSNAGMYRRTPIAFVEGLNPYRHPPGEECDAMIAAAVEVAIAAPAPAVARAAWLAFTVMSVHPFVDGNGRSARCLHLLTASADLPLGIDWGVVEQWSLDRAGYVDALRAGQMIGEFDPSRLDASPFMTYAVRTSTAGARLGRRRAEALAAGHARLVDAGLDDQSAVVLAAIDLLRVATLGELAELGLGRAQLVEVVNDLLQTKLVHWVERGAGRRTPDRPEPFGLARV